MSEINVYMSSSLASAKRRRAGVQPQPQVTENVTPQVTEAIPPPVPPSVNGRMSLPQLLNNFENRLKSIESSKPVTDNEKSITFNVTDPETGAQKKMSLSEYMTDMDNKFFMLADEITTMKDILIKLQSFTMEVNKTLMEERIRILSDIPENIKIANEEDNATIVQNV
jgi:hypothetical protein